MSRQEKVFIVPHSHWDREWYMPFEAHRFRLVSLMDSIINIMESDPEYLYYHLDGQMIILEDYLKIKPYMRERLLKLIRDGRIQVGPWYVLQDEFLTSSEANVRNMLMGFKTAADYGVEPTKIGYLPDSFGNISQMPQILKKLGIHSVIFGRGINNTAEVIWCSEDGSSVLGGRFIAWYNNAAELPTDKDAALERAGVMLRKFREASKCSTYLGMNGSDHQPLQTNLKAAINAMNEASDNQVLFCHGNLEEYIKSISACTEKYPVVEGELAGQNTNGYGLLVSTASARIYLKQKNLEAQNALERIAEPICTMAYLLNGKEYPADFMLYAWKKLLKNHAHDSICGCSIDEVHREMMNRYEKVLQVADSMLNEGLCSFNKGQNAPNGDVVVFNSSVFARSGIVEAVIDLPEDEARQIRLVDYDGNEVNILQEWKPHTFTYVLPDDSFRRVEYKNRFKVRFNAENVPPMGYKAYRVEKGEAKEQPVMKHTATTAENEFLRLAIEDDGSFSVTDKKSGKLFRGLNAYEDCVDKGDEYLFVSGSEKAVVTNGSKADISLKIATPDYVTFTVLHTLAIPSGYDRACDKHCNAVSELKLQTEVTLPKAEKKLTVSVKIQNQSGCHRLRAVFPNDIKTEKVLAGGQFDVIERNIETAQCWRWPTNEQRMLGLVTLKDSENMLTVATRALQEYEVLRDGSNTLCVTLLRCTDQLGDWGEFPTPDAQCMGENNAEYEIYIGGADDYDEAQRSALQFAGGDMPAYHLKRGAENSDMSCLWVEGCGIFNTAFKAEENGRGAVLRLYNAEPCENTAVLNTLPCFTAVYEADLKEEKITENILFNGKAELKFKPKEIKTLILDVLAGDENNAV